MRNTLIVLTVLGASLIAASISMLVLPIQPALNTGGGVVGKANVTFILYAGEPNTSTYAFGSKPGNLTSPGPTLSFHVADVVNVTVVDVGIMPHAFVVTDVPNTNAKTLFGAVIASGSLPLNPGERGSVVFKADSVGTYYYICPVPGHVQLGMWGKIVVVP